MMYKVCSQWASNFIVPASSNADDYLVKFFTTQKAVCSCRAYRYSGEYDEQTCKHIKQVKENGCFWYETSDDPIHNMTTAGRDDLDAVSITQFSTTKEGISEDDTCPSCGRPLLVVYTP